MGDKEGVMAVGDDMGEGMQCSDHPYGNNLGGICPLCLQEKLGKLVSSSNGSTPFLSVPPHPSSSSSSPSYYGTMRPPASSGPTRTAGSVTGVPGERSRVPFLSAATHKKKSSGGGGVRKVTAAASSSASTTANNVVGLKRSKSVAPRPTGGAISDAVTMDSPRKKSFWSFLYLSSSSSSSASTAATSSSSNKRRSASIVTASENGSRDLKKKQQQQQEAADGPQSSSKVQTKTYTNVSKEDQEAIADSPGGSQASSLSFGRKVARSRSVGCGSRSFSGDFLERISTGFGDCTLRRVESHRESNNGGKHSNKMVLHRQDRDEQRIKERVKCGGIFGGFGMISSSSTDWLSVAAAAGDDDFDTTASSRIGSNTARASSAAIVRGGGGRSRIWGWAFASPMRAFRPTTTTSTSSKSYATTTNAISSINAAAIGNGNGKIINGGSGRNGKVGANPSLLAVGG